MVLKIVRDKFPVPSPEALERMRAEHRGWSDSDPSRPFLKQGAALGPAIPIPDELMPPHLRKQPAPLETFYFPTAKRADATYLPGRNRKRPCDDEPL